MSPPTPTPQFSATQTAHPCGPVLPGQSLLALSSSLCQDCLLSAFSLSTYMETSSRAEAVSWSSLCFLLPAWCQSCFPAPPLDVPGCEEGTASAIWKLWVKYHLQKLRKMEKDHLSCASLDEASTKAFSLQTRPQDTHTLPPMAANGTDSWEHSSSQNNIIKNKIWVPTVFWSSLWWNIILIWMSLSGML